MTILKRLAAFAVLATITSCVVESHPYRPYYYGYRCPAYTYWDGYRCRHY
jgi:hypothetical protein